MVCIYERTENIGARADVIPKEQRRPANAATGEKSTKIGDEKLYEPEQNLEKSPKIVPNDG